MQLVARKYVEKGSSVTLHCKHNVRPQILYKVNWLRNEAKFFEFINGRNPPFRNFSVPGAEIDWSSSNEEQVTLKNLDFEAAGLYYCEVSTSTPIFTKASQDEQIHVILPQTNPPRISFNKRHYVVGERLVANCTTSKARPPPHITWLINGKKVDDKHVRALHPYGAGGKNVHRSKSHPQQNSPPLERNDIGKNPRGSLGSRKDETGLDFHHETNHHTSTNVYNRLSQLTGSHENNHKSFDNKYFDVRKHRNSFNRKYRRYVSESGGNAHPGSGPGNIPHGGVGGGSGPATRTHRGVISSSQLSIEVSELHIGSNGKLEITCLATIPAHVGPGEQFADYKTYSIKVDVEKPEISSPMPPMGGMAALGNGSFGVSIHRWPVAATVLCIASVIFAY